MDPFEAIPGLLSIVRNSMDPAKGLTKVVFLCAKAVKSPLWEQLPSIDTDRDVSEAASWLQKELVRRTSTTGVYLGLDTLNMEGGRGTNVEIGGSPKANPSENNLEWMYECKWYGRKHLIRGLLEMRDVYAKEEGDLYSLADYVLFLVYSGLVLATAIEQLPPGVRAGKSGRLFAWGFHDGDLFPLLRAIGRSVRRLAADG